jgi:S-adenosylmethionine hydrolase
MKVVCIDNKDLEKYLTISKIYETIVENKHGYIIINDNGCLDWWYPKECFKTIIEIRNKKINKLLDQ